MSLTAILSHFNTPTWLVYTMWVAILLATLYTVLRDTTHLFRPKAGLLIATSLLLSPYAAGNANLVVLTIGLIPLFLIDTWPGLILIILINLNYLLRFFTATSPRLMLLELHYAAIVLTLSWAVLFWWLNWRQKREGVDNQ